MQPNPQTLRDDLLEYIEQQELGVFHCEPETLPTERAIWWDVEQRPDYRDFFRAAERYGVKLIYFYEQEFGEHDIERLEDALEVTMLPDDEMRAFRRRLADFRGYFGFLCRVGVGFQADNRMHWFDVYATWYFDYLDTYDEIRMRSGVFGSEFEDEDDDDEEPPMGGYYSRN